MPKRAIIIGTTRPNRKGEQVARWVFKLHTKRDDDQFELVDLRDYDLSLFDEPMPPSRRQ